MFECHFQEENVTGHERPTLFHDFIYLFLNFLVGFVGSGARLCQLLEHQCVPHSVYRHER